MLLKSPSPVSRVH